VDVGLEYAIGKTRDTREFLLLDGANQLLVLRMVRENARPTEERIEKSYTLLRRLIQE
jgi:hypothetical protein